MKKIQTKKNKTKSNFGWKKAFSLYSWDNFIKASKYPALLSVVSFAICVLSKNTPVSFISLIADLILNISPVVIGFLLSGYALIIGFSSNEVMKFMSNKPNAKDEDNNSNATLYQKQNVVFAIAIICILFGLLFAVITSIVLKSEVNFLPNNLSTTLFNNIIVLILLFIVYFSIFAIKDMVINVFNFGQLIHYLIQKEMNQSENNKL